MFLENEDFDEKDLSNSFFEFLHSSVDYLVCHVCPQFMRNAFYGNTKEIS